MTYIGRRQATVSQWVALSLIFEVFAGEKRYKGGVIRRDAWWCQEAEEKKLWATWVEAQEARIGKQRGGGGGVVVQWEPGDGIRRVGSWDGESEMSNTRV